LAVPVLDALSELVVDIVVDQPGRIADDVGRPVVLDLRQLAQLVECLLGDAQI
jgi:hypothetical protein